METLTGDENEIDSVRRHYTFRPAVPDPRMGRGDVHTAAGEVLRAPSRIVFFFPKNYFFTSADTHGKFVTTGRRESNNIVEINSSSPLKESRTTNRPVCPEIS